MAPRKRSFRLLLRRLVMLCAMMMVLPFGAFALYPTAVSDAALEGWFTVDRGRILDPTGKAFIPVGVNANGPNWVWADPTLGQSPAMLPWHFNTLRLNTCLSRGCESASPNTPVEHTNDNLDAIIAEYTTKKYVIIVAQHSFGLDDGWEQPGHYRELETWWKQTASRYKDNPYVWFNLLNEPVSSSAPDDLGKWQDVTSRLAAAVRSVAPRNMLVIDGHAWGQDKGGTGCDPSAPSGDPSDPFASSAIVKRGPAVARQFGPAVFDIHVYNQWDGDGTSDCTDAARDATLAAYVNKVHSLGLALLIGETGTVADPIEASQLVNSSWNAVHTVFRIAPDLSPKVGIIFWHGSGEDELNLFQTRGPWYGFPRNSLNWQGQELLEYAQSVNP